MKHINKLFTAAFFSFFILAFAYKAVAQNAYTKQVIIASSGQFGNPQNYVRVGAYNPQTKVYTVFDSVHAPSTKSILIDGKYAYVTADTLLLKYDIDNHTRVVTGSTGGLNSPGGYLATYKNYILATRGFGATNNYVVAYNKSDLKQAFVVGGISNQASGLIVAGDTAYVGVAGPYNKDTGTIAVIDLVNMNLKREVMLDTLGAGINKLFRDGNNIYTVNTKRSIVSVYNILTGVVSHKMPFAKGSSNNAVAFKNGRIYTDFAYSGIGYYDIASDTTSDLVIVNYGKIPGISNYSVSIAGAAMDTINDLFYVTATNYISSGKAYIFNMNGNVTDSFMTGVSPEAIAIDYRSNVGIKTLTRNAAVTIYPNPANNFILVSSKDALNAEIIITDITGKTVYQNNISGKVSNYRIGVENLNPGVYIVNIKSGNGIATSKFIKQ